MCYRVDGQNGHLSFTHHGCVAGLFVVPEPAWAMFLMSLPASSGRRPLCEPDASLFADTSLTPRRAAIQRIAGEASYWSERLVGFPIAPMPIIDMLSSFNTSLFYVYQKRLNF